MKAANLAQLHAALDRASARLFLLHGPDESAADELAARLAAAMGPDAERVDLEPAALKADPALLAGEAAALSLFGGRRHIRVRGAGEDCADAAERLLSADVAGNPVVMIAPGVKASGRLVKLAVAAGEAVAHACYVPTGAQAVDVARTLGGAAGLRLDARLAERLVAASGGDRAVMAREVEKLALYLDADPTRPATLDDAALDAIGADLGEADVTSAVNAAVAGDAAALGAELALLSDTSPIPLLRALVRRLMSLAEMQAEVAGGASVSEVMKRHRVFFKEEAATARAIRAWPPARLSAAIDHLREAERSLMARAPDVTAAAAALAIARAVRRGG
ncbi:DNA polymerase III subunit delta [Sphingomonas sp.]|uniref:DNA polymerase III subunit delta n=1 Tax=Sphingomonas sp. TaxID=28214 RepID=UPI001E1013DC|nr:DNA polymerase III subunit delta [Sphingomonas sp.]MBX9795504.1 DNA polymerase III subunit delta [Sphingomonas sp.]